MESMNGMNRMELNGIEWNRMESNDRMESNGMNGMNE